MLIDSLTRFVKLDPQLRLSPGADFVGSWDHCSCLVGGSPFCDALEGYKLHGS